MAYKRYKSEIVLSKQEKVSLMAEYINYYQNLIKEYGTHVLNIKIPRKVFDEILDSATDLEGLEKLLTSIKDLQDPG